MLYYVVVFFILSIVSGYFGFWHFAGMFALISKSLAVTFLVLFVGGILKHLLF